MMPSTNLALRPFRNERVPWLLTGILLLMALVLSFLHGRLLSRLISGDEANIVRAVRQDEARIAELEDGIAREPPLRVEPAELARLRAYKELVDRRVFPWRRLLAELEGTLSDDVRLNRISPSTARGVRGMLVELAGVARTKDAAFSLAETLDASPVFSNASLRSLSDTEEGTEFGLEVIFDPLTPAASVETSGGRPATPPGPASSPSPVPGGAR
ncbi:MAG: PilN domain-containing protein [Vicinamibacteria bacterium]|nr:PilN domain-containing protein [Vicinamibacteria bacterium]